MKETRLSPEDAFCAMCRFLQAYYDRSGQAGDLAGVLGDIQPLRSDGLPADPAAWQDWLDAVKAVETDRRHAIRVPPPGPRHRSTG